MTWGRDPQLELRGCQREILDQRRPSFSVRNVYSVLERGTVVGLPDRIEPPPLQTDPNGVVRVGGTRVTLDSILHAYRRGDTPEEIGEGFPTVPLAALYAAIAYYLRYRDRVDAYLAEQEAERRRIRREIEERFPVTELREKVGRLHEPG